MQCNKRVSFFYMMVMRVERSRRVSRRRSNTWLALNCIPRQDESYPLPWLRSKQLPACKSLPFSFQCLPSQGLDRHAHRASTDTTVYWKVLPIHVRGCTHPVSPGYELLRVGGSLEASYGHLHASLAYTIVVTASFMSGNIGEGHALSSVPHYLPSLLLNIFMYLYLLYQDIKYRLHLRSG